MSWNKKIKERVRKNKIKACFLLTFLVFLGLSLFSYHPQDSSFNFAGLSTKVSNYCGFIGASLADGMYQLIGLAGAWLLVIGGIGLAGRLWTRPLSENHLSSFILFLLFLVSCISLTELHFPLVSFFNEEVSLGGVFSQGLVSSLQPLLGKAGTGVILWSSFLAFTLLYGQTGFPFLLGFPRRLILFFVVRARALWKKRAGFTALLFGFIIKLNPLFLLRNSWDFLKKLFLLFKKTPFQLLQSFKFFKKKLSFFQKKELQPELSSFSEKTSSLEIQNRKNLGEPSSNLSNSKTSDSQDTNSKTKIADTTSHHLNTPPLEKDHPPQKLDSKQERTDKSSQIYNLSLSQKTQTNSAGSNFSDSGSSTQKKSGSSMTAEWDKKIWSIKSIPPIDLLMPAPNSSKKISSKDIEELSKKLLDKLQQFSIQGEIKAVKTGPALVLFEYKPEDHVKVSQIRKMESDLSLALSSESIRIIAPIPGRDVVGIEASMPYREIVYLKQLLTEKEFSKAEIPLVLGRSSDNKIGIKDLSRIPHLLVAGTTGSGKSMFIISFISSLLLRHTPDSLKLLLVDPKQVDLSSFKDIPHLLAPIISSAPSAVQSLYWAIQEMEKRYRSLAEFKVRDHKSFNEKVKKLSQQEKNLHKMKNEEIDQEGSYYFEPLPLLCIVVEEFGDLMADPAVRRSIENAVVRLAQKARASGIHLVLAMQSPRKDVLTGLIKTNVPGRISFKVASGTDSRVILDDNGAERLLSHGDMLFLEPGSIKATRYHGPFIRDQEVSSIVSYWKSQSPEDCFYDPDLMQALNKKSLSSFKPSSNSLKQDAMYDEILEFVKSCDVISASLLQRKFQIGYPRAGRIIQDLFDKGQIGPPRGSKPREVLISK